MSTTSPEENPAPKRQEHHTLEDEGGISEVVCPTELWKIGLGMLGGALYFKVDNYLS